MVNEFWKECDANMIMFQVKDSKEQKLRNISLLFTKEPSQKKQEQVPEGQRDKGSE